MTTKKRESVEVGTTVGIAIKANRLERGWSQIELAKRAELSREFVSMLETRKRSPSLEALQKIAACFDKVSADLLNEVDGADEKIELGLRLQAIALSEDTESLRKLLEFAKNLK